MNDVTDMILTYREATRHLWNTYFMRPNGAPPEFGNLDRYEEIDKLLFTSLVLEPVGKAEGEFVFREDAHPFLHVLPRGESDSLRIRPSDPPISRSRSWNDAVNVSGARNAKLEFIECFDWDRYGWVSFPFFRVRIRSFPENSHLEGLEGLVEVQAVRIELAEG
jgi:hypothetical protein